MGHILYTSHFTTTLGNMSNKMNKPIKNSTKTASYNEEDMNANMNINNNTSDHNMMINDFFNNHIYCGQHADGYDYSGPIIVYHYISKERLGARSVSSLSKDDYDEEIWPGDNLYRYCEDYM